MSIDGVPAQKVIDELSVSFPEAARGNASLVFHSKSGQALTAEQKLAIADIVTHIKTMDAVADTLDPFALATTMADAEKQIADGKIAIADGKLEISKNEQKIVDGQKALDAAKGQLARAYKQLKDAKAQRRALMRGGEPAGELDVEPDERALGVRPVTERLVVTRRADAQHAALLHLRQRRPGDGLDDHQVHRHWR
jgi:RND superfamily putative drug exporter